MGAGLGNSVQKQDGTLHDPQKLCAVRHALSDPVYSPNLEHHLVCFGRLAPPPSRGHNNGGCTHERGCKTDLLLAYNNDISCNAGAWWCSNIIAMVLALICNVKLVCYCKSPGGA